MAQSLQEWMFGGIPPGENKTKHTTSNEVLAEGKGNMEWVVEEGSCKYQLWPPDQFQKRGLYEYLFLILSWICLYIFSSLSYLLAI